MGKPEDKLPLWRGSTMNPSTLVARARSVIEPYLIAGELVGVCVLVRLLLDDFFLNKFFSTVFFYPAIILAAFWCGARPALLAVALSCLSIRYFFMRPPGQFLGFLSRWDPLRLMLFACSNLLIIGLVSHLQASKRKIAWMAVEADEARSRLLGEIAQRITVEKQLREEQAFLRQLIDHQELEKQTLCNDFHDGLIQNVVGSKMLLEAHFKDASDVDPIREVVHHLRKGIEDGRRVIRGIRPSVIDEPGLDGLFHELVSHFSALGFEVDVQACLTDDFSTLTDRIRTAIFRICQESLTNCWKHSGCSKAGVRISQEGDSLLIVISDDGCGMSAAATDENAGFGLRGLEARARLLGGTFAMESGSRGTRVVVRLPLTSAA